jgi:hypothetical protein
MQASLYEQIHFLIIAAIRKSLAMLNMEPSKNISHIQV